MFLFVDRDVVDDRDHTQMIFLKLAKLLCVEPTNINVVKRDTTNDTPLIRALSSCFLMNFLYSTSYVNAVCNTHVYTL